MPLHLESVIYRLIETVRDRVAALLPPIIETRVNGEATVLQVFTIAIKGQKEGQIVAGCRIGNGVIGKNDTVRVIRGDKRDVVFEGESASIDQRARCLRLITVVPNFRSPGIAPTLEKGSQRG